MSRVLITGGSSGLGACLAAGYAKAGDHVTVADIAAPQGSAAYVYFDCGQPDFEWLADAPPFDIVICNAGISDSEDFLHTDSALDERLMRINTLGHMALVRELLRQEKMAHGGRLAFIVSASVFLPFPIAIAYAASKAALDGFALALEAYLVGRRISVTRIYPGPMRTPHAGKYYSRFNEGKGASPEIVARRIVKALQKRKQTLIPDMPARLFYLGALLCPALLARLTHRKYFGRRLR
ncbi:MAG: SDR family oxidoreductase [Pseudomonadota bacterium]|nr:SDR family oxidoreductase [Pseudomonadota bacterium]